MTTMDELFSAFPGTTLAAGHPSFTYGHSDHHQNPNHLPESAFIELFYKGEFTHALRSHFTYVRSEPYTLQSISFYLPTCTVERSYASGERAIYLLRGIDWWASVTIGEGHVGSYFGGQSMEAIREMATRFQSGLETSVAEPKTTNFEIWSGDDYPTMRNFDDTEWAKIQNNYTAATRKGLEELAGLTRADTKDNGRIILFHGPPGTGKTWAIRSLLTSWKEWSRAALVLDPERMLNQINYFMNMVTFVDNDLTRIVVIEDADEIAEKGGTRGAGISRLLNATDGIVGATSNLLILLSTNAPPSSLDAALVRPGRCLATIEFGPFSASDASARLGLSVDSAKTLAELYEEMGKVSKVNVSSAASSTGTYL